MQKNGLLQNLL